MNKREFLKAVLKGKISANQLKGQPERHFTLVAGGEYDIPSATIVDRKSRYKCREDGSVYMYEQIETMQSPHPGLISSVELVDGGKITQIELLRITTEDIIKETING